MHVDIPDETVPVVVDGKVPVSRKERDGRRMLVPNDPGKLPGRFGRHVEAADVGITLDEELLIEIRARPDSDDRVGP